MSYNRCSLRQRPDLSAQIDELSLEAWPEFLHHGNIRHWKHLYSTFADHQILICDGDDKVAALGHTVPLIWDGSVDDLPATIDDIIVRALQVRKDGRAPNTLAALAAMVEKDYRGQGLSSTVLQAMRTSALHHGWSDLIVPVRPTWKSRYPLIPFARYCKWTRADATPFDPWIRVHWRLGATQLRLMPRSLTVRGTIAQWQDWTGLPMPDDGDYVVSGALQPVFVNRAQDRGTYEDPNVWMRHSVRKDE